MILRDWREADAGLLRSCYDTEQRSWRDDLGWDTAWTWTTVEQARTTWGLPGVLALDDDNTVSGWAFYMHQGATLHVGGLVASTGAATAALLDGILDAVGDSEPVACFIRDRAPGLSAELLSRGFDVERFLYLSRSLPARPPAVSLRRGGIQSGNALSCAFTEADHSSAAVLLRAAYSPASGRHFAPNGTLAEWENYVAGVVGQGGCGVFDDAATGVVRDAEGLQALALMTSIAPETAHLAQLAVRPDCRGRGLASTLLHHGMASAARAGKRSMTLLVGEHNATARTLYGSLGFIERGSFVGARCEARLRVRV
jgi:ribosomal protein S18 acetylase RimI-like enzyme